MLAAIGDTAYNVVLVLHVLTVVVAFAPAFVHPILANQSQSLGDAGRRRLIGQFAANGRRIYAPALILTGILGFGLSGMSDGVFGLGEGWLIASIVVWIAMNGVLHAMVIPGERAVADGDDAAESRVNLGGAVLSVLLLVMLYLMVFKPGA